MTFMCFSLNINGTYQKALADHLLAKSSSNLLSRPLTTLSLKRSIGYENEEVASAQAKMQLMTISHKGGKRTSGLCPPGRNRRVKEDRGFVNLNGDWSGIE